MTRIVIKYTRSSDSDNDPKEALLIDDKDRDELRKERRETIALSVLCLTLVVYIGLGVLQWRSNNINSESEKASHSVWVVSDGGPIESFGSTGNGILNFGIKNVSDMPALGFKGILKYKDSEGAWSAPLVLSDITDRKNNEVTILPQSHGFISTILSDTNKTAGDLESSIDTEYTFDLEFTYHDFYGRHVDIHQILKKQNAAWVILTSTVKYEGYN